MNAGELLAGLSALAGATESGTTSSASGGADGGAGPRANGITGARLVNGVEYAAAATGDERRLRAAWRGRRGGGATPLVLVADDPARDGVLAVLGPEGDGPLRGIRASALLDVASATVAMTRLDAVRHLAQELRRLDLSGLAGLTVRGLGTEHLYQSRLPRSPRWARLAELADGAQGLGWRELLIRLGYEVRQLPRRGYLATAGSPGRPALVVHPRDSADHFARLDADGRLPEGALLADCAAHGVDYGLLAAGTRLRLLATGAEHAGSATTYLDLDTAALEAQALPLLGLLAPAYLAEGGFAEVMEEARDYGQRLRLRLDRVLRQDVLPVLGRELGAWAAGEGRDLAEDRVREDLEAAALTFVFRALFLLYAEGAGHLPMGNRTYAERSLTRVCARAEAELPRADPRSEPPRVWWRLLRLERMEPCQHPLRPRSGTRPSCVSGRSGWSRRRSPPRARASA